MSGGIIMRQGRRIAERLAGSIKLDDQELIDEIIESDMYANFDENLYCDEEAHQETPDQSLTPIDIVRLQQSQNPGKGDYTKERSHVLDLEMDEIVRGIEKIKKAGGR